MPSIRHDLTALGFQEQVDALVSFLRSKDDFLDYNFKGSVLSMIIELLSYNSYNSAFAVNMIANESFLETAELRQNVLRKARELGYLPRSITASSVSLSFKIKLNENLFFDNVYLKKGTGFQTIYNQIPYSFVVLNDVVSTRTFENEYYFTDVKLYEGTYVVNDTIFSDNRSQRFIIDNSNVDVMSIRVRVGNEITGYEYYNRHTNLIENNSSSPIYYLNEVSTEQYEIIFADGVLGKRPNANDSVEISYLATNGPAANGATVFTFNGLIESNQGTISSFSPIPDAIVSEASGGTEAETTEQIKRNAPREYQAQHRAVTIEDYKSLVHRIYKKNADVIVYSGLDKTPPMPGFIFVSIKDNDNVISIQEKENLLTGLSKYSVDNSEIKIVDPSKLIVEFDVCVTYNRESTSLSIDEIIIAIKNTLRDYVIKNSIDNFGNTLYHNKLLTAIDSSQSFFNNVSTDVIIAKEFLPLNLRDASYELCYQNKLTPNTINSTFFRVLSNVNQLVQLKDDGNGILRLHNQQGKILNFNVGYVDYNKAEILIDSLVIVNTNKKVKVNATPQNKTINTYREAYIDVRIDSSKYNIKWF